MSNLKMALKNGLAKKGINRTKFIIEFNRFRQGAALLETLRYLGLTFTAIFLLITYLIKMDILMTVILSVIAINLFIVICWILGKLDEKHKFSTEIMKLNMSQYNEYQYRGLKHDRIKKSS